MMLGIEVSIFYDPYKMDEVFFCCKIPDSLIMNRYGIFFKCFFTFMDIIL